MEAEDAGSAALLARLDAALVTRAAHEAMEEELLTLRSQVRDAVHTLKSVRGMTAALSRVGRDKAERLQKEISETDIGDLEALTVTLGLRMDVLGPRALDNALPAHEMVVSEAQDDSEAEPPGGVGSPAEDSAGSTGGIPTENSAETEDEEEHNPPCDSVKDEATSHETPAHSRAEEAEMPPSGTSDVHEEDPNDATTQAKSECEEGGLSGDADVVHVPEEPPSTQQNEEEHETKTLSPSQSKANEEETPTDQNGRKRTPPHGTQQSHSVSAAASHVNIDPTNIRTLSRTCLHLRPWSLRYSNAVRVCRFHQTASYCGRDHARETSQ